MPSDVTDVQFSEMIAPTFEREWASIVMVDASRCASKPLPEASARAFVENITHVCKVDPEGVAVPGSADRPRFVA